MIRGVTDPLLEQPRAFAAKVARVLGGTPVAHDRLTGALSSGFDAFLNQLFAEGWVAPREAVDALAGRPGFVWLAEEPAPEGLGVPGTERLTSVTVYGMTADTSGPSVDAESLRVRSHADLDAWHEIYCEVFGVDTRGRDDWHELHDALGPTGDDSLLLLLARVDGAAAATGGLYVDGESAGLYCFTTHERMRARGLGSALVQAAHEAARTRGIERAVLQATAAGRPMYARLGYEEVRPLPMLVAR